MTLVKPKDLAVTLNVSVDTIYRMADRGDIPSIRVSPSVLRFDEAEVLNHLKQQKAKA